MNQLSEYPGSPHTKIAGGRLWCSICHRTMVVHNANHWPKCCGYTMTIDSPEERKQPNEENNNVL